ncbi:nuclear speckle splicing regulatory protein 1 isoform X1 [Betta splendens]|uniref:Nuclear speckle splicing regulatory protein 1 n=2 Tax=Betta splendens TaxID=158456 RepID=A0A6P7PD88_BETSP|nr:nuclear speckle splicing regulatory protein 1 isoform X1 [Betta splendens]
MAAPTKQYGLILSQKKGLSKTATLPRPSVFGDDSDDETSVGETLQKEAVKKKMMKQTRLEMQKALEQDSTVYDYDAVYDDIQKERNDSNKKLLGGTDKKPKYIQQLMKAVEDRKKEQERREERKIQKEREAEGDKFADKDAYVTSAYKQKLLEQKEEQERERREAEMEAALDVKKQKDLSGFYRHLLNQTVGEEAIPDRSANKAPITNVSKEPERISPVNSPISHDKNPSSSSDSEDGPEQKFGFSKPGTGSTHLKRQYRQRSPSSGSEEDKEKEKEERDRHKKSHRDKGRDRDRGREKDDRHGGRREDRDRRKDRDRGKDRDRERDEDRSRGRADTERESRHGKRDRSPRERERDRSPRERERDRNGEREKRRHPVEDKRRDKDQEDEKEGRKEPEKTTVKEEKDAEKKEDTEVQEKEKASEEKEEETGNKFAKRSTDQTVCSARERYMARQMARSACKSYIEKEED